ncbi:MAG TPA: TrmH family RNA methyltransferase [Kofleriaceae bacterium]|nr:TrmH family RNA methyltransferase [Kofleriaceae bacterium]
MGNNIENPGNVAGLEAAARMFGWDCAFVADERFPAAQTSAAGARAMTAAALAASGLPIIALENGHGAEDLHRFRPPRGRYVLIAGNERKGIAGELRRLAGRVVEIPNASARLNTLNVAAAAAVALHQLTRSRDRQAGAGGGRPEVLLDGPTDAIELGSVIRSATCFGWSHLFVDDRHHVWFATDRVTRSLGRGAARRGRNPIAIVPARGGAYEEVLVVTATDGEPLRRADVALGPDRLVVIPDAAATTVDADADADASSRWHRLGRRVRRLRVEVEPGAPAPFRLVASIALAELARRCHRRPTRAPRPLAPPDD